MFNIPDNSWKDFFQREMSKSYFPNLEKFLEEEYSKYTIYPKEENVFKAFEYTPLDKVKVVIVGQDPYVSPNQAIGIAFATGDNKVAPSLRNIYKEINSDLGLDMSNRTCDYPINWARQGVFMLNTVLTVRAGESNSHKGKRWELFTDAAIEEVEKQDRPLVFMLWGNQAKKLKCGIHNPKHLILEAAHPSPLSASRGFFGCKHFSKANHFLKENGMDEINW